MPAPRLTSGRSQPPATGTPRRVKWLLWAGVALALVAAANLGYLIYGAVAACCEWYRVGAGSSSPLFGLVAARVRWGVGGMLFGSLASVCAMAGFRRARGKYVTLALAEVAVGGLALLVVLAVYWSVWDPM